MKSLISSALLCVALAALSTTVAADVAGEKLLAETDVCRVWLLYPVEKVRKQDLLGTETRIDGVVLSAARGESEPFILVVRPRGKRPVMDLRFDLPVFKTESTATAEPESTPGLDCRRIGYVQVDSPSGTSVLQEVGERYLATAVPFGSTGLTGALPDRLLPEPLSNAMPGENTQFWFTIRVPRRVAPGNWRGVLLLRMRTGQPISIPIRLRVRPFALPRRGGLKNTTCWSPQYLADAWNEERLRAFYRDLAAARQATDPILPLPGLKIAPDGDVEIETAAYEKMLDYCLNELGMTHAFFPRVGGAWYTNVYFLWHTPAVLRQRWYGISIFQDDLNLTVAFKKTFGAYVQKMAAVFRRLHCRNRIYMATMDEPQTAADLTAVRRFADFVKTIAPKVRLFCTTYPRPELAGVIDAWCPQRYDGDEFRPNRAAGDELMFYKNWIHLIDMPMVNPRLYGWIARRIGATGWLTYAVMGRWDRAWDEPYAIYPNTGIKAWGLGLWWYPALLRPEIIHSVRWEMMREGAEDYEYLRLLQDRLDTLPAERRDAVAARRARAFLQSALKQVIRLPSVFPDGGGGNDTPRPAYTRSNRVVGRLRDQAAHWIEALAPAPAGP
ncbi:MAG: DUF4091 domain-containing protein [Kiritimatiellaeota bacterium]|nr:DUF4091 domain-containing protein [Kiritimatiellota bacterium]